MPGKADRARARARAGPDASSGSAPGSLDFRRTIEVRSAAVGFGPLHAGDRSSPGRATTHIQGVVAMSYIGPIFHLIHITDNFWELNDWYHDIFSPIEFT